MAAWLPAAPWSTVYRVDMQRTGTGRACAVSYHLYCSCVVHVHVHVHGRSTDGLMAKYNVQAERAEGSDADNAPHKA